MPDRDARLAATAQVWRAAGAGERRGGPDGGSDRAIWLSVLVAGLRALLVGTVVPR